MWKPGSWLVQAVLLLAWSGRGGWARPTKDENKSVVVGGGQTQLVVGDLPRLAIYFQTTHDSSSGKPISMLPLITEKGIALTHLIVCSLHVNAGGAIHLNDYPPSDGRFATLWNETAVLRQAGVTVMGMVGGAAGGSFDGTTLDGDEADFEHYYAQLHDVVERFGLQGMDLDVEQSMSLNGIERLVERLHGDFGAGFAVTLAPVASALGALGRDAEDINLSGFDYNALEAADGRAIAFYNAQFYNGFGSLASPAAFQRVVAAGWPPSKVLMGQITAPDAGSGFVPFANLSHTVAALQAQYGSRSGDGDSNGDGDGDGIGGIMGWEYFNSAPGGTAAPWEWAQQMTAILRPDKALPQLRITVDDARRLTDAWRASAKAAATTTDVDAASLTPNIDYMALVNA